MYELNKKVLADFHIIYELPMNKVVQAIKNNGKVYSSFEMVETFLNNCTTATPYKPYSSTIRINEKDDRDTQSLKQSAEEYFGVPKIHFDGLYNTLNWRIDESQLKKALTFLSDNEPYPKAIRPYISLRVDYYFRFLNPKTKEVLAGQEIDSHLAVFFERNSKAMAEFLFPFAVYDDFSIYYKSISEYLPFKKVNVNDFRKIGPNKKKTNNVIRKIDFADI